MVSINQSIFSFLALATAAASAFTPPSQLARFTSSTLFSTQEYIQAQYSPIDTEILDSKTHPASSLAPAVADAAVADAPLVEAQEYKPPLFDSHLDDFRQVGPVATWGAIVPTANNTYSHSDLTGDPRVAPFNHSPYAGFRSSQMRFRGPPAGGIHQVPSGDRVSSPQTPAWGPTSPMANNTFSHSHLTADPRVAPFKDNPYAVFSSTQMRVRGPSAGAAHQGTSPIADRSSSSSGSATREPTLPMANNTFSHSHLTADPRVAPFKDNPYAVFSSTQMRVRGPPAGGVHHGASPFGDRVSSFKTLGPSPTWGESKAPGSATKDASAFRNRVASFKQMGPSATWGSPSMSKTPTGTGAPARFTFGSYPGWEPRAAGASPIANNTFLPDLTADPRSSPFRNNPYPSFAGPETRWVAAPPRPQSPVEQETAPPPPAASASLPPAAVQPAMPASPMFASSSVATSYSQPKSYSPSGSSWKSSAPKANSTYLGGLSSSSSSTSSGTSASPMFAGSSNKAKPASYAPKASWKSTTAKANSTYLGSLTGSGGSSSGGGGWATATLDTTAYPVAPSAPVAPPASAPAVAARQAKPASYAPKASWKSAAPKTNSTYLGSLVGAGV